MKNKILFLIFFALANFSTPAQTVIGKYAGEFLSFGIGGRALGMGSAQAAIVNDVTAGYWNPAGLASIDYPEISLMHEEHFGSLVNFNYAGVAIPYKEDLSFAISVIRLSVDGIPDTRNALVDMTTGQVIYDINNPNARWDPDKVTEFNNTDWAFYFSFAQRRSEKFHWGANIKIIRRNLAEATALGIGFDVGAIYSPFKKFFVGANLMDVTTTIIAWSTGRNELITPTVRMGAGYRLDFLGGVFTPALDVDARFENRRFASNFNLGPVSFDFKVGGEFNYKNIFAVRAGYNDIKQFTVGAGIKLPKLNIDYSFARMSGGEFERLPDTHRISVMLTLEEPRFYRNGN